MDHLQIELLYCRYGWSVEKIASAVNKPETYVKSVIKDHHLEQGEPVPAQVRVEGQDRATGQALAIQNLKDDEVSKQAMLAPLVAITEMRLLDKLARAIEGVDENEPDAHVKLANMVKSFKQLTQDTVTSKVVEDSNGKPAVAVQVITQIM